MYRNTRPGVPANAGKATGRRVRFVAHELAEYVVAAALVAVGFHVSGAAQLLTVSVGAAMLVLGACSDGRLGAFELLSRRAHHVGDVVLIVVLALSPILLYHQLHVAGTVLAEVVALVLLRIERGTMYVDPPSARRQAAGRSSRSPGVPGSPSSAERLTAERSSTDPAARIGAAAGAAASTAVNAATQLAPVAGRAARIGIRSVGLVTGAAKRAARERAAERRAARRS